MSCNCKECEIKFNWACRTARSKLFFPPFWLSQSFKLFVMLIFVATSCQESIHHSPHLCHVWLMHVFDGSQLWGCSSQIAFTFRPVDVSLAQAVSPFLTYLHQSSQSSLSLVMFLLIISFHKGKQLWVPSTNHIISSVNWFSFCIATDDVSSRPLHPGKQRTHVQKIQVT